MDFTVAIVGRPNVGKSTLFNRLVGKRVSIVDDKPGVTRDRIYGNTEWNGKSIVLIDTGGIEPYSKDIILSQMKRQADFAMDAADVILFLVDARDGITSSDEEVGKMLRRSGKPVILVINKVDDFTDLSPHFEFYSLGFGEPVLISAAHGLAIGDLLDMITEQMAEEQGKDERDDAIKIAVAGKPNVGKSSLVNAILGEDRVIVSHIPGTTRDAIDTPFEADGQKMVIIDTAGLRRKSRISEDVEYYSTVRAVGAIEKADVVLMVLDGTEKISEQDKRVAGIAHDSNKGIIVVVNKWDIVEKDDKTTREYTDNIRKEFAFMQYAPIIFVSAKTGQRVRQVMESIKYVWEQYNFRVKTSMLNDLLQDATAIVEPPTVKGKKLKIYYAVQAGIKPPAFIFFVNDEKLFHFSYARYLENQIRGAFNLKGTPITIRTRAKKKG